MLTAKNNPWFHRLFAVLLVLCPLAPLPASAASSCCLCSPPNAPDTKICLGVEAIDAGAGCATLATKYKKLQNFTCFSPPSNAACANPASAASLCPKGVVDVKAYAPTQTAGNGDESSNSTVQPITLGVAIPGLTLAQTVQEKGGYAYIPFLAEYISGVYRYAIGISVVAAAIMLVYGGLKYILASSGFEIKSGKEIIQEALVGLALLLGAVTVLTLVNPATTSLAPLRVQSVRSEPWHGDEEGDVPAGSLSTLNTVSGSLSGVSGTPVGLPKPVCSGAGCKDLCTGCVAKPDLPTAPSIALPSALTPLPKNSPGLSGSGSLRQEAVDALVAAGKAAASWPGGPYTLRVMATSRTLSEQVTLACQKFCQGLDADVGINVATPGGSVHGSGLAVDLELVRDADKLVSCCTVATQTKVTTEKNAKLLQDIMGSVGWVRYCKEVWHFEWGTDGVPNRSKNCPWPPS